MQQPGTRPEAVAEEPGGVADVARERLFVVGDAAARISWTLAQRNGVVIAAQTSEADALAGSSGDSPEDTMVMDARKKVNAAGADNSMTVLQRLDDAA